MELGTFPFHHNLRVSVDGVRAGMPSLVGITQVLTFPPIIRVHWTLASKSVAELFDNFGSLGRPVAFLRTVAPLPAV